MRPTYKGLRSSESQRLSNFVNRLLSQVVALRNILIWRFVLYKNENGVYCDCEVVTIYDKGEIYVKVKVAEVNGKWGAQSGCMYSFGGYGSPLTDEDFIHLTRDGAIEEQVKRAINYLECATQWKKSKAIELAIDELKTNTQVKQLSLF